MTGVNGGTQSPLSATCKLRSSHKLDISGLVPRLHLSLSRPGTEIMNRRLTTILLSAFIVAVLACYGVYRLVEKQIRDNAAKSTVTIVTAARDLDIGTLIKASDLATEQVGKKPQDDILKVDNAIGRGVIAPVFAGEPLSDKRLAKPGSGAGFAATIPPGMRACAVKVDNVVDVAGFAVPGMRVDVLISGNTPGSNPGGTKVRTLLQNIEVLSADKNFQPDKEGKPAEPAVVNLLVTPEQAEVLSLANSNETRIQLVLRNPVDTEVANPPGTDVAKLFGKPEPATPQSGWSAAGLPPLRLSASREVFWPTSFPTPWFRAAGRGPFLPSRFSSANLAYA